MDNCDKEVLEDALALKEKGNQFIKDGNFKEAALLYTQAIKIEPNNFSLYSNRSLAYLRLKHYYLSLQDAIETIRLQPQWAKGYFRKAEVEAAVGLTDEAALSYTRALQLQPQDISIISAIKKVTIERKRKKEADEKLPWLCCCVGVIIGVILVILDYVFVEHVSSWNPIIQVLFIFFIAGVGWGVGKQYLILDERNMGKSLRPPNYQDPSAENQPWVIGLVLGITIITIDITVIELIGLRENPFRVIGMASAIVGGGFGICSFLDFLRFYKNKTNDEFKQADDKLPLLCGCAGIIIGVFLVILDYALSEDLTSSSSIVKLVIVLSGGALCWCVGKGYNMIEQPFIKKSDDTEEDKWPWTLWVTGLIIGLVVTLINVTVSDDPASKNPLKLVSFAFAIAGGGFSIGLLLRRLKLQTSDKREEEVNDPPPEENHVPERTSNKYTKAQARYRYKKGKM